MDVVTLNVCDLEPPAPMQKIMQAVSSLTDDEVIWVKHRREPIPLFNMLTKQNIPWHHHQIADNTHHIFIWSSNNKAGQNYVNKLIKG